MSTTLNQHAHGWKKTWEKIYTLCSVYGVKNLRVVDASVMPHVTSSNTQAPCYMIGDKAAEMIMEEWGLNAGRNWYFQTGIAGFMDWIDYKKSNNKPCITFNSLTLLSLRLRSRPDIPRITNFMLSFRKLIPTITFFLSKVYTFTCLARYQVIDISIWFSLHIWLTLRIFLSIQMRVLLSELTFIAASFLHKMRKGDGCNQMFPWCSIS